MSSSMNTSPLRFIAKASSKPEKRERYTATELVEKLHEVDFPLRRRSAFRRTASNPVQNNDAVQTHSVSPFETTDVNGYHLTIDCHINRFMDLPPRTELDETAGQPKLTHSDVVHANFQAGTTMPKKSSPSVPDLPLKKQMECAVYANNAPNYIKQARQQANCTSLLPSFSSFSGVFCSPSSAANMPTVRRGSPAPSSHDGCPVSFCSCCKTCSTCPTISSSSSTSGRSSRMRGHKVLEANWARRREYNSSLASSNPVPVVEPTNELDFSRRPVQQQQQQPKGFINHLLNAVKQDMHGGSRSRNQHVRFAHLSQPSENRLTPTKGLTATEMAALHAFIDELDLPATAATANNSSPPFTPSPATTTAPDASLDVRSASLPWPTPHPLLSTFGALSPSEDSSSSLSSSSRSSILPPHTKSQGGVQKRDSVMDGDSSTSSFRETHAARFKIMFGARFDVEDLPDVFGDWECEEEEDGDDDEGKGEDDENEEHST